MAMVVPSSSHASNYHVFLSFRGQDTRHAFAGNLYKALTDKGIHAFIDHEELQRGEEITPAVVKAIQGSKIAIIVLSKDYASSSFCLDELTTIIHCAQSKGLLVLPVFYNVDPSNVRHLRGSYEDALTKHEKKSPQKLQIWKEALRKVADLSGYHFKQGVDYEYKFIGSIVDWVSEKINHPARLRVGDYFVGFEPVVQVMKLLDVGSNDVVHMVGIHGMGGVGKSTLARAVYNKLIAQNFDGLCYLENVKKSNKNGLEHLQNLLLQEILGDEKIKVTSVERGALMIPQRLRRKKVLLVLDDVDKLNQLEAIVGRPEWFGLGSRIIITTRDQQLLACHHVKRIYELKELNEGDALQLLTWKAFKKEKADPTYLDVLNRVLLYDDSSMKHHIGVLIDKSLIMVKLSKWGDTVKMHDLIQEMGRQIDHKESHKKPQKRKRLWLWKDIVEVLNQNKACETLLNGLFLSLLHIFVSQSYDHITGGTSKIEIIYLDVPKPNREETIEWDGNGFKEMKNLKILMIKNAKFSEGPKCLPNSLRVLEWWGYPSNCLPSDFQPHKFVTCNLSHGCFTSFELYRSSKMFKNLTVLKFDHCQSLTQIPDLSNVSNLRKLSFEWCYNLVTVHESIGHLGKVKEISGWGRTNLVSFPPIHLTSLEKLNLSICGLESFPEISGKMENIRRLQLARTRIKDVPSSIVNLIGLQEFILYGLYDGVVIKLPSSIFMMPELTHFRTFGWEGIKWVKEEENEETMGSIVSSKLNHLTVSGCGLGDDFFSIIDFTRFAHVTNLDLSWHNFTFLPECIKEFQYLRSLTVEMCEHLQEIRGMSPNIKHFNARNCKSLSSSSISMFMIQEMYEAGMKQCLLPGAWIPEWFDEKSSGPSTSFWFRNKLPTKIFCFLIAPAYLTYRIFPPNPMVFINGKIVKVFHHSRETERMLTDHTYIFELDLGLNPSEVALRKEWNHVEIKYREEMEISIIKASGIHVLRREGGMEDIRFSDPGRKRKLDDYLNNFESDNRRLLKRCRFVDMEEQFEQQQNCLVSCLLEWACTYFPAQCSHCIIM